MITLSDISEIIYDRCKVFDVPLFIADTTPLGEIDQERIVIIAKSIEDGKFWERCFVEVNWCVPDLHDEGNLVRVKEVERLLKQVYYGTGTCDNINYRFKKYSTNIEWEKEMRYHIANVRLMFNIQKVLENG